VSSEALVIPSVDIDLVLGLDFWERVGLVLDCSRRQVQFKPDNSSEKGTV